MKTSVWDKLLEELSTLDHLANHYVSVVIPTYNSAHNISLTIDSILMQGYEQLDIVVIDAGSTDRTLAIIKSYESPKIHVYSVAEYDLYEMCNRGLALAHGKYVAYLVPGDYYLSKNVIQVVSDMATANDYPDLVYAGSLLRYGSSEPQILQRPLTIDLLKQGKQATSLQGCWFKKGSLKQLGGFRQRYKLRAIFDVLCRYGVSPSARIAVVGRVVTDFDRRSITHSRILQHFWDTLRIIKDHFGCFAAVRWSLQQKDMWRSARLWFRHIKLAFLGR